MSRSEAARKAWATRRARGGGAKASSASKRAPILMMGVGAGEIRTTGGRVFKSRFTARSAKAIPAMLAEVARRGYKDHVVANHGTHYAVYFNPQKPYRPGSR